MAGEWPALRLGDVCDLLTGFPFRSEFYSNDASNPRLLRGDNIAQGILRWDNVKRWPKTDTKGLEDYWLKEGDVILAMDRPWIEAGLKYASVKGDDLPALLVQRVARLRGTKLLDTTFLKYVIGSRAFTEYVLAVQTGTAVPHISGAQIKSFAFHLPSLCEQQAIGTILGTLDDKIELNRKQNETLEAMARALFKAWFVDFEPVRAKMEGRWERGQSLPGLPAHLYDRFPDRLVESELGEIPQGWKSVSASQLIEFNPAEPLRKGMEAPYIEMAALPTSGSWPEPPVLRPFGSGMRFRNGDTLLARITPCLENGKTAYVQCLPDNTVGWGSTEYIVMRPKTPVPSEFGYLLARDAAFREQAIRSMTGTSGRQRVQADSLGAFKLAAPSNKGVWDAFSRVVAPAFESIKANAEAIATLAKLRDTLLPQLISGELRVRAASI